MCELVKKKKFVEKTFADCSLLPPKDATPPNFAEKTFVNSHKTSKFTKVLSLKSFPLYGSSVMHVWSNYANQDQTEWPTILQRVYVRTRWSIFGTGMFGF